MPVAVRLLSGFVLVVLGSTFWTVGGLDRQMALAHRHLATLQYAEAVEEYDRLEESLGFIAELPWLGRYVLSDLRLARATAGYWLSDDGAAASPLGASGDPTQDDADALFLTANAAYRQAFERGLSIDGTGQFDRLVDSYAKVLELSAGHLDAAYNYEYMVRLRVEDISQEPETGRVGDGDHRTIHGAPGAPPQEREMGQFKVVIPKEADERDEDPGAGSRQKRVRKG